MTTNPSDRVAISDVMGRPFTGKGARNCLKAAGLDFDVNLVPLKNPVTGEVVYEGRDENDQPKPKYYATIRSDTKDVLGVVEGRFVPTQNRDVFEIGEHMVDEDGAIIKRAFAIDNGSRCFMNLEWPKSKNINVVGDIVARRAMIHNPHNGKYSTTIRLQPLRLYCLNGAMVPVPCFSFEFRIIHTASATDRLNEARRVMKSAGKYFESFGKIAAQMAKTKISENCAKDLLKTIVGQTTTGAEKKRDEILGLFNGEQAGGRTEALFGTAWGFFNAITEFADHSSRTRLSRGSEESVQRFKSMFEGSASRLKLNTWEALIGHKELGLKEFWKDMADSN